MEAFHKNHRPHMKVGKDAEEKDIGVEEPGDEESIGIFRWGTRNMKGR